ncbi:MAG TPA: sulfatase-like hydrolase/transferase, partial [Acidimicrobiia bacterium]
MRAYVSGDRERGRVWRLLELVTLVSFAVTQPVLWAVGENPVFLVAHDVSGMGVVWFALAALLLPTAVFVIIDLLSDLLPDPWRDVAGASLRGILIAFALVPTLIHAANPPPVVSIALLVVASVVATLLWLRSRFVSKLVSALWFAPLVFVLYFVVASGARALAFGSEDPVISSAGASSDTSVVWLIFDQLPLSLLVDETGEIVEGRYPNFARLARESTWFAGAMTVSSSTAVDVPAALTGKVPDLEALPVVSDAPTNLFTLLGRTHRVHAWETFTQLCPDSVCREEDTIPSPSVGADTWVLAVRKLFGDRLSDHLVPSIEEGWAGFGSLEPIDITIEGEGTSIEALHALRARGDDRPRIDEFVSSIESSTGPSVNYLHLEKPHEPLLFLPDGRTYGRCECFAVDEVGRWPDTAMTTQRLQGYLLQTIYADTILGRVLDALDASGERDDTVLVVMSDHGASLLPGTQNRVLTKSSADDILPVPVFIRVPGRPEGVRDGRQIQITSILPTVLDALGVEWQTMDLDGVSLLDPAIQIPEPVVLGRFISWGPEDRAEPSRSPVVAWIRDLFPDVGNPYV